MVYAFGPGVNPVEAMQGRSDALHQDRAVIDGSELPNKDVLLAQIDEELTPLDAFLGGAGASLIDVEYKIEHEVEEP